MSVACFVVQPSLLSESLFLILLTVVLLSVAFEYGFICFTFTLLKFPCFAKTCEGNKGNCIEGERKRDIVSNNTEDNSKTDIIDNLCTTFKFYYAAALSIWQDQQNMKQLS